MQNILGSIGIGFIVVLGIIFTVWTIWLYMTHGENDLRQDSKKQKAFYYYGATATWGLSITGIGLLLFTIGNIIGQYIMGVM
ncbi:MAG: hypothetical protein K9L56_15790 [Clostridiales bacterium]|nr:hypothetical protein [Clostridiales bacterium]